MHLHFTVEHLCIDVASQRIVDLVLCQRYQGAHYLHGAGIVGLQAPVRTAMTILCDICTRLPALQILIASPL